ncbi:MAG: hypothetical protein IT323_22010 [Anaerolineae bacterium]|nr:hypothetical protein [Anaerolineae bacterium]
MNRDKWLSVGILIAIGLITFGLSKAWRSTAYGSGATPVPEQTRAAQLAPTDAHAAPPAPPSPVLAPTDTPGFVPTATEAPSATPLTPTRTPTGTPVLAALAPTVTPHFGAVWTAGPSPTAAPMMPAQQPAPPTGVTATVVMRQGLSLRAGPGGAFTSTMFYPRGAVLPVVAQTNDGAWLKVSFRGQQGWVAAQFAQLAGDLSRVPTESAGGDLEARPCISIVGDSVPYGEVIFELPQVGFIKVKMSPFTEYLTRQLTLASIFGFDVTDRSYPGVGISSPVHNSYYEAPVYPDLIADRCQFTVVLPWINDLSSGLDPEYSANEHAQRMAELVRRVLANNPRGRILIANYYPGNPAPFSSNMAYGFTPTAIAAFNAALAESCQGGELSQIPHVLCMDVNVPFAAMDNSYVVGPMSREQVAALQTRPLSKDEQDMLDYLARTDPDARLIGDGIHLSPIGKTVLASYIVNLLSKFPEIAAVATPTTPSSPQG